LAYSSPPVSPGRLVVGSTWRVRHCLEQVEHPQLLVITPPGMALIAVILSEIDFKDAVTP
jgi:hypothetical protein